jgi:hypothetical protein
MSNRIQIVKLKNESKEDAKVSSVVIKSFVTFQKLINLDPIRVRGIVTIPSLNKGVPYLHYWCEVQRRKDGVWMVYDETNYQTIIVERDSYYETLRITKTQQALFGFFNDPYHNPDVAGADDVMYMKQFILPTVKVFDLEAVEAAAHREAEKLAEDMKREAEKEAQAQAQAQAQAKAKAEAEAQAAKEANERKQKIKYIVYTFDGTNVGSYIQEG